MINEGLMSLIYFAAALTISIYLTGFIFKVVAYLIQLIIKR